MKPNKEFVRETVAEILCRDIEEIGDETSFVNELNVNSVEMLEIVAALEDEYDIEVKVADFSKYDNINSIISVLDEFIAQV